jgi:amidophosphoribosyltransferase
VRYSTAGESSIKNCQPFTVNYAHGALAVAHNGNIVNAKDLRDTFEKEGAIFQSTMDTEVVMHLMAKSRQTTDVERLKEILPRLQGAFSLVFLTPDSMIAARDPDGFRPLVIGAKGEGYVVASETCALDLLEAKFVREVEPGEIVTFDKTGVNSFRFADGHRKRNHCIFEYVYFARPDSNVFGRDVYEIRKGFGRMLAKETPVEADVVVPVPDSGVPAAIGYSRESGIPFELGLVRNHYVGRTFIEPEQKIRHFGVKVKLNPIPDVLKDKRVVLVDDSIVRGTTSQKIIRMVRNAGAKEVHLRISSPPTNWPCFYGIDTPSRRELISAQKSVDEIRDFIQADSLSYLSVDALYWFEKQKNQEWFCDACFTGNYPVGKDTIRAAIDKEAGGLGVSVA